LITQYREGIARRRKVDCPGRIASRGTRERWYRCSSHGCRQDWPPSLRGAGVVHSLRGSRGHLPAHCRTSATGCACGAGRGVVRVAGPPGDAQRTVPCCAPRCSMWRPLDPQLIH